MITFPAIQGLEHSPEQQAVISSVCSVIRRVLSSEEGMGRMGGTGAGHPGAATAHFRAREEDFVRERIIPALEAKGLLKHIEIAVEREVESSHTFVRLHPDQGGV